MSKRSQGCGVPLWFLKFDGETMEAVEDHGTLDIGFTDILNLGVEANDFLQKAS